MNMSNKAIVFMARTLLIKFVNSLDGSLIREYVQVDPETENLRYTEKGNDLLVNIEEYLFKHLDVGK